MNRNLLTSWLSLSVLVSCLAVSAHSQSNVNRFAGTTTRAGVLEPYKNTEVATAEVGIVKEIYVKPGQQIKEGTLVGRLDDAQQQLMVHEAELDANAMGVLETARKEVEFNERRVSETLKLVATNRGTAKELERYQLELSIAKAKLQTQEETRLIMQARLDKAKMLLRDRTIRAPHDGTVVEVYRKVGEYIASNSPALIRLMDTSQLRARFYLTDEAAEKYRAAETVEIRLANSVVVEAQIEFIAPFANAEGHVTEMTVLIDNKDGRIHSSNCELLHP